MAHTLHRQVVCRACDVLGKNDLADRLRVSRAMLESWMAGRGSPPPRLFFRLVDLLQSADPTYRPLGDAPPYERELC